MKRYIQKKQIIDIMVMLGKRPSQTVTPVTGYLKDVIKLLGDGDYTRAATTYGQAVRALNAVGTSSHGYSSLKAQTVSVGTQLLTFGMRNVNSAVQKWDSTWDRYAQMNPASAGREKPTDDLAHKERARAADNYLSTTMQASKPFLVRAAKEAETVTKSVATIVHSLDPANSYANNVLDGSELKKLQGIRENLEANSRN